MESWEAVHAYATNYATSHNFRFHIKSTKKENGVIISRRYKCVVPDCPVAWTFKRNNNVISLSYVSTDCHSHSITDLASSPSSQLYSQSDLTSLTFTSWEQAHDVLSPSLVIQSTTRDSSGGIKKRRYVCPIKSSTPRPCKNNSSSTTMECSFAITLIAKNDDTIVVVSSPDSPDSSHSHPPPSSMQQKTRAIKSRIRKNNSSALHIKPTGFTVGTIFRTWEEANVILNTVALDQNFKICIKSTTSTSSTNIIKRRYVCSRAGKPSSRGRKRIRKRSSNKCQCPFSLVLKQSNGVITLSYVNNVHNHTDDIVVSNSSRRFYEDRYEEQVRLLLQSSSTKTAVAVLQSKFPDLELKPKDVYNDLRRMRKANEEEEGLNCYSTMLEFIDDIDDEYAHLVSYLENPSR